MEFYTKAARKFLDLNWDERIYKDSGLKRKGLASMLDLRYRQSLRMCKRNFGLTIEKFFIHCRVMEIKQFLAQPENKEYEMLEIAYKLGYSHRSNFNRHFKQVTGISQREFRYFHEHFVKTTGMPLVEYQEPKLKRYMPPDGNPTFLSNFLNRKMMEVFYREQNL